MKQIRLYPIVHALQFSDDLFKGFAREVIVSRSLFLLAAAAFLLACTCLAQTADPTAGTQDQNASAQVSTEPTTPLAPEVVVPDAKDGKDKAGRPVKPVGAADVEPPPPVPPTEQQDFSQNVKDVYFDVNRAQLRRDDRAILQRDAEWLKAHPDVRFTIAGQADPRGGIVYNLFLSDERAIATRDALLKMGVSPQQIVFSEGWGKLYLVCEQNDESCWSEDRRAHLEAWSPKAGPLTNAPAAMSGEE